MDGKVVLGAVVGAALGAAAMLVSNAMNSHKKQVNDLGYDWPYAKADPELCEALHSLKSFRHADPQCYFEIGTQCDNLVSLYAMVHNKSLTPEHSWTFKSFQYRLHVERKLTELSMRVAELPSSVPVGSARKGGRSNRENKRANMEEYRACADAIDALVKNYHNNIINDIRFGARAQSGDPQAQS